MRRDLIVRIILSLLYLTQDGRSGLALEVQASTKARQNSGRGCPAPPELAIILGDATNKLELSEPGEVVGTLQQLAPLRCDPRVDLLLAASLEESGRLRDAEDALQEAVTAWPDNTGIATSLAREYLSEGRTAQAADAIGHFQVKAGTQWQEIELATVVLLTDHRLAAAESIASAGYKLHPSLASLLLWANCLQLEGRYKDVIVFLNKERSEYRQSAAFLITLGESEFDAASYNTAASDLAAAILLHPRSYQGHYLLGNTYLKKGDPEAAAKEYRVALDVAPDQPRTYYYLALAFRAEGKEVDEEDPLKRAIALDGHYALAHAELGRILLNEGRLADAESELKKAVEGNPSSEQAYYLLARAYERLGDAAQSQATTKRLLEVRKANHSGQRQDTSKELVVPATP